MYNVGICIPVDEPYLGSTGNPRQHPWPGQMQLCRFVTVLSGQKFGHSILSPAFSNVVGCILFTHFAIGSLDSRSSTPHHCTFSPLLDGQSIQPSLILMRGRPDKSRDANNIRMNALTPFCSNFLNTSCAACVRPAACLQQIYSRRHPLKP